MHLRDGRKGITTTRRRQRGRYVCVSVCVQRDRAQAAVDTCSWLTIRLTSSMGTANATPSSPSAFNVLTPITSPRTLSSGPPELPELIAASVCMYDDAFRPACPSRSPISDRVRSSAETMPMETELLSPSGAPSATTNLRVACAGAHAPARRLRLRASAHSRGARARAEGRAHSPGRSSAELPRVTHGSGAADCTRTMAISEIASACSTTPGSFVTPSESVTVIFAAPPPMSASRTTCLRASDAGAESAGDGVTRGREAITC